MPVVLSPEVQSLLPPSDQYLCRPQDVLWFNQRFNCTCRHDNVATSFSRVLLLTVFCMQFDDGCCSLRTCCNTFMPESHAAVWVGHSSVLGTLTRNHHAMQYLRWLYSIARAPPIGQHKKSNCSGGPQQWSCRFRLRNEQRVLCTAK